MNNKKNTKNEIKELNEMKELISREFRNLNLDIETLKFMTAIPLRRKNLKQYWYSICDKKGKKMKLSANKDLNGFWYEVTLRDFNASYVIANFDYVDSKGYVIVDSKYSYLKLF